MNKLLLKKILLLLLIPLFYSCKQDTETILLKKKPEPIRYSYGFKLNDFKVIQDTVKKEDTFGSIIEKQNLNGKQVYDVIAQVKDSFNVRIMRLNKPYLMLLSKEKNRKLQYFIYQPNQREYYIVNFNDSLTKASKKILPITIKRRTVSGELNGSLSETLKNEGIASSLSSKLINVYKWSIDFFKSKKRRQVCCNFYRKIHK